MASTSTNKQPLLVDRPLLAVKDTSGLLVGTLPPNTGIDPANSAGVLLVDCLKNDGALIEHLWTRSREVTVMSYEFDPAKVPPNPKPADATYIGELNISGGGASNQKSYTVTVTPREVDGKLQPAPSDLQYKWTVSGEASIEGTDDTNSVTVRTAAGESVLTVKVTSTDEKCINTPQFASVEINYKGPTGGVVSALDTSSLPTSGTTYTAVTAAPTTTSGEGNGLTLTTTVTDGNVTAVKIVNGGVLYAAGETVTIAGSQMGAKDGDDDLTFQVTTASSIVNAQLVPVTRQTIKSNVGLKEGEETTEDNWVDPNPLKLLGYIVNFYLCPSNTVFKPNDAYFIGGIVSGVKEAEKYQMFDHPEVLAPVTGVGSIEGEGGEVKPTYARALYIPKGQCLWACAVQHWLENGEVDQAAYTPLACVQGGYY